MEASLAGSKMCFQSMVSKEPARKATSVRLTRYAVSLSHFRAFSALPQMGKAILARVTWCSSGI